MGFHVAWEKSLFEEDYVGAGKNFFFCLADSSTLAETSVLSDFFNAEIPIGLNGYSRKPIVFTGPAIFDNATKTIALPTQTVIWTPSGGSLQYQTVFLIADGASTGQVGTIAYIHREAQVQLKRDGQPFQVELTISREIETIT